MQRLRTASTNCVILKHIQTHTHLHKETHTLPLLHTAGDALFCHCAQPHWHPVGIEQGGPESQGMSVAASMCEAALTLPFTPIRMHLLLVWSCCIFNSTLLLPSCYSKQDMLCPAAQGTSIMSQLSQAFEASNELTGTQANAVGPDVAEHALVKCAEQLAKRFDAVNGGFGGAPK